VIFACLIALFIRFKKKKHPKQKKATVQKNREKLKHQNRLKKALK